MTDWKAESEKLRNIAASLALLAKKFNTDRKACTCGESEHWCDQGQWQLNTRVEGVRQRLLNIAEVIDRTAVEFVPKQEPGPSP